MSAFPATCKAALAVPGPGPSSMSAVTVTWVPEARGAQEVGALTLVTIGPCCTHFALRHTCPTPHFGSQGSLQRLLTQVAGEVHWLSFVQAPSGDTEQAASAARAAQAARVRLIGSFS